MKQACRPYPPGSLASPAGSPFPWRLAMSAEQGQRHARKGQDEDRSEPDPTRRERRRLEVSPAPQQEQGPLEGTGPALRGLRRVTVGEADPAEDAEQVRRPVEDPGAD